MDNLSGKPPSSPLNSLSQSANCPPFPPSRKSKTKNAFQSAFQRSKGKRPPRLTVTSDFSDGSLISPSLSSPGYALDSSSESEHRPDFSTSKNISNRVSSALKLSIPKRWKRSSKPNSPQSASAHLPTGLHKQQRQRSRTYSPERKSLSLNHSSSFPSQPSSNHDTPAPVADLPNSSQQRSTLDELAVSTLSILPLQTSKTSFFVGSPSRSSTESNGSYIFRTKSSNSFSSSLSIPSQTSNRSANFDEQRPSSLKEPNKSSLSDYSLPPVEYGENTAAFLERLQDCIPARFMPGLLSQSNLSFMKIALRRYLSDLPLKEIALDMALRKFLALFVLPQETQQIDRVLSSFSDQYYHCNPSFYESSDECYILTFSLMILHTDFYNINNRQKMTKSEFIANTNLPNIMPEILECFYDNITYTPFVHVEEDPNSLNSPASERTSFSQRFGDSQFRFSKRNPLATESHFVGIEQQLTGFRLNLQSILNYDQLDGIPVAGSSICPNAREHYKQFMNAPYIQIVSHRSQPQAFSFHFAPETESESTNPAVVNIKVVKLGIIIQNERIRKDKTVSGREVGVVLTSSKLMFFKNTSWVEGLISQLHEFQSSTKSPPHYFTPSLTSLDPDYIIPLSNLVAFHENKNDTDGSYSFIIKQKNSTTYMFSTESEHEMNDWIYKVNFVSAFATSGIAPREKLCCADQSDTSVKASVSVLPEIEEDKEAMTKVSHETGSEMLECSRLRIFIVQNRICKLEERLREVESKFIIEKGNVDNLLRMAPIQSRTRVRLVRAANNLRKVLRMHIIEICKLQSSIKILKEDLELDNHLQRYLHSVFPPPSSKESSSSVLYPLGYAGGRTLSNASKRRNQLRLGNNPELQNLRAKSSESEVLNVDVQDRVDDPGGPKVKQDIVTCNGQRLSVVEVPDDFVPENLAQESVQSGS